MSERKYSVSEIDDLRSACRQMYLYGTPLLRAGASRSFREADMIAATEEMTRTYMFAGITADDLRQEYKKREEAYSQGAIA